MRLFGSFSLNMACFVSSVNCFPPSVYKYNGCFVFVDSRWILDCCCGSIRFRATPNFDVFQLLFVVASTSLANVDCICWCRMLSRSSDCPSNVVSDGNGLLCVSFSYFSNYNESMNVTAKKCFYVQVGELWYLNFVLMSTSVGYLFACSLTVSS